MRRLLVFISIFTLVAFAAEIAGTWKGTAEGPMGTMDRTFVFKVEADKLTGETTSSYSGKSTIMDGKVDGDNLSFWITVNFQGTDMRVNYKGKVAGNEMKLTAATADGSFTVDWNLKKST